MPKFAVDFEGWIEVEAPNGADAISIVFRKLNEQLSPLMNGGEDGDWEITGTEDVTD